MRSSLRIGSFLPTFLGVGTGFWGVALVGGAVGAGGFGVSPPIPSISSGVSNAASVSDGSSGVALGCVGVG